MVKRTSLEGDACPIARALDVIGDWWSLLLIRDAFLGTRRFGEFQRHLGLAKNTLSPRLRARADRGILAPAPASDGSAYQQYVLTPKGRGLFTVLVALRQWSEQFDERPEEIATLLVDRNRGKPVRKLALYSEDGRTLGAEDTTLKLRASARGGRRVPPWRTGSLRQLAPAADAKVLLGFHLGHPQEVGEQIKVMALRQPRERRESFQNQRNGLIRAIVPCQ